MSNADDQELLGRYYDDRDNKWLGILLERYTLLLYGVCMKYLKDPEAARDAVQQIFLKAITELAKYRVSYFPSWIYMIARNHCLMELRRKTGRPGAPLSDDLLPDPSLLDREERVAHEWQLVKLETAIDLLNPEQRRCVRLFYLEKRSYQDIAGETGFTLMQVKSHIQNGKRNLRIMLEKRKP